MKPPHAALHGHHPCVGQPLVQGHEPLADRKRPRDDVVVQAAGLGDVVCRIHAEEGEHQQHLRDQNHIGVQRRPAPHFRAAEPGNRHAVASNEEDHACQHHQGGQHLERPDEDVVQWAQEGEHAVGAQQAVDHDLEQFDVDDHEPHVNQDVHDSGHRSGHHLALAQGHACHHLPTVRSPVGPVHVLALQDVPSNESDALGKQAHACGHTQRKEELGNHGVTGLEKNRPPRLQVLPESSLSSVAGLFC